MKRASRFAIQPKGTFGSVAPPSFGGNAAPKSALSSKANTAAPTKPARDYFEDDEEEDLVNPPTSSAGAQFGCVDDDYDPLDDFMANIQDQVKQQAAAPASCAQKLPEIVSGLDDGDFGAASNGGGSSSNSGGGKAAGAATAEDLDELEGYLNGTAAAPDGKTRIEPLPAVDHSTIAYHPFRKSFYVEHKEVAAMSAQEVEALRDSLDLHVTPHSAPRPLLSFQQAGFDSKLLAEITAAGYEQPTAIQAQAVPIAMSGYDLIGLAKTGSGKTLAYLWPMIVHILAQPQMAVGDGPIALVLAPTRELAAQIHTEARKFATKVYNIRTVAVYGGGGKWEMSKALRDECPEIVIATPGRFIEMVRNKSTNLRRCTMVVLDEADRMFEMGFEYQMLSIVHNIRPDRQVLMFSATMKRKIESFAREILENEVKIVVGKPGQANADIAQKVELFSHESEKLSWLRANIDDFSADGKVLIFVLSKAGTEEITAELNNWFTRRQLQINVDCLHGDKDQSLRTKIMHNFTRNSERNDALTILVATDIAARGLDVKDIRTVINYDVAKNIETYVHRIGRTGRMGVEGVTPGTAYTLLTPKDSSFAVDLVQNLNLSAQPVSPALLQLAQGDPKWGRVRHIQAGGGYAGGNGSGGGKGVGERGGLGFGAAGISQGRASVALTSSMMANSDFRNSNRNTSQNEVRSVASLPAGLQAKFQRAHCEYSSVSAVSSAATPGSEVPSYTHSANLSAAQMIQRSMAASATGTGASTQPTYSPAYPAGAAPPQPNTDFAPNPYIQGHSQGRGKHLTQPSWMANGGSEVQLGTAVHADAVAVPTSIIGSHQFADHTVPVSCTATVPAGEAPRRKSRFSAEEPTVLVPLMPRVPTLPGFVRAGAPSAPCGISSAGSSVNSSVTVAGSVTWVGGPALMSNHNHSSVNGVDGNSSIVFAGDQANSNSAVDSAPMQPPAKKSRWDS